MTGVREKMEYGAVLPGFADAVFASQSVFRALLRAMSRPGTVLKLSGCPRTEPPLAPAAAAVCLTLLDFETPLWLAPEPAAGPVAEFLRFHCGCPLTPDPAEAAFALVTEASAMPRLDAFCPGVPEYPDRSTTVIVQTAGLAEGGDVVLAGPGICETRAFRAEGLPEDFWTQAEANRARFPLGVDVILVSDERVAALPRTVRRVG